MEHLDFKYLKFLDRLIPEFLNYIKRDNPDIFKLGDYPVEIPLKKHLFMRLSTYNILKEFYCSNMKAKGELALSEPQISSFFMNFLIEKYTDSHSLMSFEECHNYENYYKHYKESLGQYKNHIVYYALNERFLNFLLPILSKLPENVVVLSEHPISKSTKVSDNIHIVELTDLSFSQNANFFVQKNFPDLFRKFNTIDFFLNLLEPSAILVVEGNYPQFEFLAILGELRKCPVICIQQGWPGILHIGFQEMQYSHFLSWGDRFSHMWKEVNPKPIFISGGYPFPIKKVNRKNAITFFLQAPVQISSEKSYYELIEFAFFCAEQFPDRPILIREHPEYPIPPLVVKKCLKYENVKLVPPKEIDLYDLFGATLISVAIFSSTIAESLAHGAIPFIFNPGLMPNYYPDLNKEKIGIEANSLNDAKMKITELVNNSDILQEYIREIHIKKDSFFKNINKNVLVDLVELICQIKK